MLLVARHQKGIILREGDFIEYNIFRVWEMLGTANTLRVYSQLLYSSDNCIYCFRREMKLSTMEYILIFIDYFLVRTVAESG